METYRKRKGFMKNKLVMSFYKVAKPHQPVQYRNKVNPTPSSPAATSFLIDQTLATPPPKQKVSFDAVFGSVGDGDENVDMKAASYISYVKERFKL
ncbi:hypothetical protein RJ641_012942 [Dillenia turbinata]|uniref:Uncharacterized protein n=1 Tax=Dillenia turbinata TaxID=194707 RepID=A0AAN8UUV8_9MAGN